jgi:hypothetical protein
MRPRMPLLLDPARCFGDDHKTLVEYASKRPLRRVLAFVGRSIDDVVNDPIARNQVYGYYKLCRRVERAAEVRELERQWNPTG